MAHAGILELQTYDSKDKNFGEFLCTLCGNTKRLRINSVLKGYVKSCGCLVHSRAQNIGTGTVEYGIWRQIKQRCYNSNSKDYVRYGARGIIMCEEWKNDFSIFRKDMGNRPSDKYMVERKDNNLGYNKDNCIWVTIKEQCSNRRTNLNFEYKGQIKTLKQWCEHLNLPYKTIWARIEYGYTIERALEQPIQDTEYQIIYNGETKNLTEWAKQYNMGYKTLEGRLKLGWSIEKALNEPIHEKTMTLTFNGQTLKIKDWAKQIGITRLTIFRRLRRGLPLEEVLRK